MIHVAVIGCGYWGPNLIRNFSQIQESTVSMACDLNLDRLASVKASYPSVDVTQDYIEILNKPEIEAVAIATPVSTHYHLAKDALLHDKHVLVEKPLTASSPEAEDLIALAAKRERTLMVGHTFEYNPAVVKVKELLSRGEIGDIYYIDSSRLNLGLHQFDINVVWDLAPHDLSIILYWLGTEPLVVNTRGNSYIQDGIADVAFISLGFPKNILAHLHVSWLAPSKLRRTTIVGSEKMVVYDDLEPVEKVKVYDRGVLALQNSESLMELQRTYRIGDVFSPYIESSEPLRTECEHFLECIREQGTSRTDGYSGLRVVKILEAADRSLRNNGSAERVG